MSPRLVFRKITADGLYIEIEEYNGLKLLLLTKDMAGMRARPVQVLGVARTEGSQNTLRWYYEYVPLPTDISPRQLDAWLHDRGYVMGVFDQFGNFVEKQAA